MTTPQQRRRNRLMGIILAIVVVAIYVWIFVRGSELLN
ncbi:cytochrome oxidase small assembly protein [Mesopusillimonas faecipullorum]|nr:cytochrome oxidase small assembly protein [Mesopusillimonas faecipullorum]